MLAIAWSAVAAERRVVFAVMEPQFSPVPGDAKLYFEPIAWAQPLAPPPKAGTQSFIKRYFSRDRRYTTYLDGRRGGEIRPLESASAGCSSLGSTAAGPQMTTPAFATNFDVPERTIRNRWATDEESATLRAYGERWYAARGYGAVKLKVEAELIDVGPDQEMLFAATIALEEHKDCIPRAIFVLAKQSDVAAGKVVPQVVIGTRNQCEIAGDPTLFGHLDFDGDGIDEIVVMNHWIEAYQYVVIRRNQAGEWRISVLGGVAGC